jgi:hypothetical protein
MKQVLTLLGPSATLHLETGRLIESKLEFVVVAHYEVPPVSMTLRAEGMSLEQACSRITWQFLEKIGMPTV